MTVNPGTAGMFIAAIAGLVVASILLGVAWLIFPFTLRRLAERRLSQMCRRRRAIALSYDDGPSDVLTPKLLDVLATEGVKATFFMIGRRADEHPEIARRVVQRGHDVGSHSYSHLNAWRHAPWSVARDVAAGVASIDHYGGLGKHFRPPFGKVSLAGLLAWSGRVRYCWWTIDSRDSWAPRAIDDVIGELRRRGGGVLLMHDVDSSSHVPQGCRSHVDYVLTLTRDAIDLARTDGYDIVTFSELYVEPR